MRKILVMAVLLVIAAVSVVAAPKKIRVLLWSEQTEPRKVYPSGISGALQEALSRLPDMEPRMAQLDDPEAGVSEAALAETDVVVWFGHRRHAAVPDEAVDRIVRHVRERGMGFVALHSAHFSKPLKKLLNASGAWSSYVNHGKPEQVWVVMPDHPIAKGLSNFTVPQTEIYTEPFEVPEPEAVILEGTWESGHRSREVLIWTIGKGRMVYIRPGHEEYPIFFMPEMQRLVANSVEWTAGRTHTGDYLARREVGPKATAHGPHPDVARQVAVREKRVVVVLNKWDDTVDLYDSVRKEKLGSVKTGVHPHEVALSPDGGRAYVTIYGTGVYGRNPEPNNKLAVIDLRRALEESQIDLSPYQAPHGVAVDSTGMVWITCENDAVVLVVDPRKKEIAAAVPTGSKGTHWIVLLPDGTKAYTSNKETPHISVIDTAARKVIRQIAVPRGVEGIGLSPDGRRLYAGDFRQPVLWVVDTDKDEVIGEVPLKSTPGRVRVSPDNRLIVISNYRGEGPGSVEVVEVATLTSQKAIPVGKSPMGIAFLGGQHALVANSGEDTISVIDLRTLEVFRTVKVGNGPDGIATSN